MLHSVDSIHGNGDLLVYATTTYVYLRYKYIICTRSEPAYWDAKVRSKENSKNKVLYSTVNYIETSESQFNPARRDRTCLGSYIQLHFSL